MVLYFQEDQEEGTFVESEHHSPAIDMETASTTSNPGPFSKVRTDHPKQIIGINNRHN